MLEISKELFKLWNISINYCHWKSNEHLSEGLSGETDLDVLVSFDDKLECEKILQELNFIKTIPQKGADYRNVDDWIGFDKYTGKLVHIHLHYNIITGKKFVKEYNIAWEKLVLETRIFNREFNIYTVSPNLEIIILYSRLILKKKYFNKLSVSSDMKREIEFLKNYIEVDEVRSLCEQLFNEYSDNIFNLIISKELKPEMLKELEKYIKKEFENYSIRSKPSVFLSFVFIAFEYIFKGKLKKKFKVPFKTKKTISKNGISICFIGADGSGKSTVSREIEKWLLWKIESQKFYLGSGDHYASILKSLKIKIKALRKKSRSVVNSTNSKTRKPNLIKDIFNLLNALEFVKISRRALKILTKSNKYLKNGGISIFDRYPQVQVEGIYDGPKINALYSQSRFRRAIKMLSKIESFNLQKANKINPDIVFKLKVTSEVSIARKPDHNIEEINRKVEITDLLEFPKSKVYSIDAAQDFSAELVEIKNIIWHEIVQNNKKYYQLKVDMERKND